MRPLLLASALVLTACSEKGVTVYGTPPSASITNPPDGSAFGDGESVTFEGLVRDDQDDAETLTVQFTSDIDGQLTEDLTADASGIVSWASANLSGGNHVITLQVVDSDADSANDTITITVDEDPEEPAMTIVHPIAGEDGIDGLPFEFEAWVEDFQDEGPDLVVTIESDLSGVVCDPNPVGVDGRGGCEAALAEGDHLLTFTVTDTDGLTDSDQVVFPVISADTIDDDGDGWSEAQGDCDDDDEDVNPGADEIENKIDDDCDDATDEGTDRYDDDGDGWSEDDGDCDDDDPDVSPDASEEWNFEDDDCDDIVDEGTDYYDDDGDGYTEDEGDCDDEEHITYPDAPETEDGVDNDCDESTDEGTDAFDDDGDGYTEYENDCDDDDPDVNPGENETCETDYDDDCDGSNNDIGADACVTYYPDVDNDGYGDADDPGRCFCRATSSYELTDHSDCYDDNRDANPLQTAYFDEHRGDGSYDYNCDTNSDRRYDDVYDCAWEWAGISLDCNGSGGWADGSAATCGDDEDWGTGCQFTVDIGDLIDIILGGSEPVDYCTYTGTSGRTQTCR